MLFEKAVVILSDMIDMDVLNKNQVIALNPTIKTVRTLCPKKSIENNTYSQSWHISAMSLLSYLDWNDVEWTDEMNEEILKIDGLP